MGKTRNTGFSNNAIQYNSGSIAFVSGSTTLLNISSSGNIVTTGTITANTLVIQTVTSSVSFVTGSTQFGSISANTHQFTGSILASGSIGIGTASPTKALEIISNTSQDGIKISGTSNPRLTIIDTTNSVQFDALTTDTEAVLRTDTNHPLHFSTNGTLRMAISSSGNVGIGTASPNNLLELSSATSGGSLRFSNSNNTAFYWDIGRDSVSTGDFLFRKASGGAASDMMRITNDGNVGIGVTPFQNTIGKSLDLVNGGGLFASSNNYYLTANAYFDSAWKYKATSGAAFININSGGDGSIGFVTAPSGTAGNTISFSQKMKINQGGSVFINTDSALAGSGTILHVFANDACTTLANGNSAQQVLLLWNRGTTGNNLFAEFATEVGLTGRGSIDFNRAATQVRYNTTSDANLKNIIGDSNLEKSVEILNSTKIKEFSWKEDTTNKVQTGVIAQELYETYKGAVSVGSDESLLGTEDYKSWKVDKTAFTFHLIAGWKKHEQTIQELKAENDALKTRIETLENK